MKRLAIVLTIVFTLQIVNQALFYHAHIIDGQLFAHAHPNTSDHQHSNYELAFYAQLQVLDDGDTPELLCDCSRQLEQEINQLIQNQYHTLFVEQGKGRSPPIV